MSALKDKTRHPYNNSNGFTLIEVMVVMSMLSILSAIAFFNYIPLRKKALDTTALVDTRNFAESVVEAALNSENVKYDQGVFMANGGIEGPIGTLNIDGVTPRAPVFILSPGVAAIIIGSSNEAPKGQANVQAVIYHTAGTDDPASISGKKEFVCIIDEAAGTVSFP